MIRDAAIYMLNKLIINRALATVLPSGSEPA